VTYTYEWESSPYDTVQEQLVITANDEESTSSRRVGFVTWKLIPQRYEARTYNLEEVQMFTSKKDAKAWVLGMVRLTN
jgi:hypothetical protein